MTGRIDVARPWLGAEESEAVAAAIASGWVAQGPRVAEFEERFAELVDARQAVALSSCTAALHLALAVADIGRGDEVIVPSLSFIATANAPTYVGARPIFADVEPTTGNLTVETIEAVCSRATRAVILVHQAGIPADIAAVREFCAQRDILVIEDAACAVGSTYRGQPVGSGAAVAAWSFHPRKLITTGEGGMLTTDDAAWAARARRLREHAMSVSAAQRHTRALAPAEEYLEVGYNYRMTDVQAAIGIIQLGRLPTILARRRELAGRYQDALAGVDGLRCVADPPYGQTNYQSFWIELAAGFALDREALLEHLALRGISARRGIMAAHRQPAYGHRYPVSLPVTERLTDRTLVLPVFHELSTDDQDRVIGAVRAASGQIAA